MPVLCAALACMVGVCAEAGPRPGKKTPAELRSALRSVAARIHEQRKQITVKRRQERRIKGEIGEVETRIETTKSRLGQVRSRLRYLHREHAVLTERIGATERRLAMRRRALANRVRENYERGSGGYVRVLLSSRSLNDYMSRSYYVQRIVSSDAGLIKAVKADRDRLSADRRRLEAQQREKERLGIELSERREQYESDCGRMVVMLRDVRSSREALEETLDMLEQSSRAIEARIRAMMTTPSGRARSLRAWTGRFIRPVPGAITSRFGMRYHPILHKTKLHTGVDLSAASGTPIHAAAGGVVIAACYLRGYGNTVIIDHGGGVTTLYGHLSAFNTADGRAVAQGQVIGRVGSTGFSTGPHLHFEVRHNGTPVNPL